MGKFAAFARIAETEFSDIVIATQDLGHKLRIYLLDKSFIDFFFTTRPEKRRFAIHWERIHVDKTIYRIDNTPDKKWRAAATFPVHFHKKKYKNVTTPPFNVDKIPLEELLRQFLNFSRNTLLPRKEASTNTMP